VPHVGGKVISPIGYDLPRRLAFGFQKLTMELPKRTFNVFEVLIRTKVGDRATCVVDRVQHTSNGFNRCGSEGGRPHAIPELKGFSDKAALLLAKEQAPGHLGEDQQKAWSAGATQVTQNLPGEGDSRPSPMMWE